MLRKSYGQDLTDSESPRPTAADLPESHLANAPSPDMRPQELLSQYSPGSGPMPRESALIFRRSSIRLYDNTALDVLSGSLSSPAAPRPASEDVPHYESTIPDSVIGTPETVFYTPVSSRSSTMRVHRSEDHVPPAPVHDGYDSPPPINKIAAQRRTEGRYRMLLTHDFHPSRKLVIFLRLSLILYNGTL